MAKKDKKTMHAAHIKRHTEGTSNEISFSVLDAAKNRADAEKGIDSKAQIPRLGGVRLFSWSSRKRTTPTPVKEDALPLLDGQPSTKESTVISAGGLYGGSAGSAPSLGTLSALNSAASSPYVSPEAEIQRRKSKRRHQRLLMALIAVVITVSAVGVGSYLLYHEISNHQTQVSLIDQALTKIEDSDKTIVAMDQIANESPENTTAESINEVLDGSEQANQLLDEAEELIQSALVSIRDSADKEAAEQALIAISARREMLVHGEILLGADLQEESDKNQILSIWGKVLEADGVAREAAELVTETTEENIVASIQKTNEALTLFEDCSYLLEQFATSPLLPDVQLLRDYLSKRIESMYYAIASDEAILAQERETAESQNEAYNTADTEASVLAKELPEPITQIVTNAYESFTEEARGLYEGERSKASTADAFLRDYLGT